MAKEKKDLTRLDFSPRQLITMLWWNNEEYAHCKGCGASEGCSRTKRECIIVHTSDTLWESYYKAFGVKDEAEK